MDLPTKPEALPAPVISLEKYRRERAYQRELRLTQLVIERWTGEPTPEDSKP